MILGAALVGLGVILAVIVVRRYFSTPQLTPEQLLRVVQQLMQWTRDVSRDVAAFDSTLERFSTESVATRDEITEASSHSIEQLITANRRLRERLRDAQSALNEKSTLIRELLQRSHTDPLTGLLNRRALQEHAERLVAQARRYRRAISVVFVDVDHFKSINDTYGHAVGDRILAQVARQMHSTLRQQDVLARYGGEEFCVLLPDTAIQEACHVAERLRRAVCRVLHPSGAGRSISISCGVASLRAHQNIGQWWADADQALYAAKKHGRDQIWYHNGVQPCCYSKVHQRVSLSASPVPTASDFNQPTAHSSMPTRPNNSVEPPPLSAGSSAPAIFSAEQSAAWQTVCQRLQQRLEELLTETKRTRS